jgi:branched-chain amino acid transport system substrate-binding protein
LITDAGFAISEVDERYEKGAPKITGAGTYGLTPHHRTGTHLSVASEPIGRAPYSIGGTPMSGVGKHSFVVSAVVAGLAGLFVLAGSGSAAAAGPPPGVTNDSIKIGFISSKTGVAAATSGDSDVGCQARVGRENAAGGVNGRKIEVEYVDDASSGQNLTAAQDLVLNKHVYMVINDSAFAFLTYRWLLDHDVPLIGGGFDGNYYGAPGNEKVIDAFGNSPPVSGIQTTIMPKMMKALGATKVAALGYGVSPSSTAAVKSFMQYGVPALGLKPVYTNTSVDFGSTDVSSLVLGIKNSGADAAWYAMNANTNLAIAQGLVQNNVKMKAEFMATGYGQQLLDQPVSRTLGPEIVFTTGWAPVEIKSKATKRFQADLDKYAGFSGVPDFGVYTGYIDCDLAILGLKQQGDNLDPNTYADDLRKVDTFNPGGGLGCADASLSIETYGKARLDGSGPTPCSWALQVKNGKFVVFKPKNSKTPYWTGKLIPKSIPPEYVETTPTSSTAK